MVSVFQEIKERVNIVDACRMYGIELNRANKAPCPFHTERTPSFSVSEKKQIWHCFGCGEGGDVVTLVQKLHRCAPLEAARQLDTDFRLGLFDRPMSANRRNIYRQKKQAADKFKAWRDYTVYVLTEWRRKRFMAYEDCAYADFLLDSIGEDPVSFRAAYGDIVKDGYEDSYFDFSLPVFEKLIFKEVMPK